MFGPLQDYNDLMCSTGCGLKKHNMTYIKGLTKKPIGDLSEPYKPSNDSKISKEKSDKTLTVGRHAETLLPKPETLLPESKSCKFKSYM